MDADKIILADYDINDTLNYVSKYTKEQVKKKRTHYVYKEYLESWTTGSCLWYLERGKDPEPRNPQSIAVKRSFYAPTDLTVHDLDFIKKYFLVKFHREAKLLAEVVLSEMMEMMMHKLVLTNSPQKYPKDERQLEKHIHNYIENYHEKVETLGLPHLQSLKSLDMEFWDKDDCRENFIYFLAIQYWRTLHMSEQYSDNLKPIMAQRVSEDKPELVKYGEMLADYTTKVWCLLSAFLASSYAFDLMDDCDNINLTLLQNGSAIPFITGDQPVVNLRYDYSEVRKCKDLEWYYPISPIIAIIFTYAIEPSYSGVLKEDDVKKLNDAIASASQKQLYANNQEILESYKSEKGR